MDEMIVENTGKSIPEIFDEKGEQGFRAAETQAAYAISKLNGKVISTGGGIIKYKANIDLLRQNGIVIFIDRDLNKLITTDSNRPLSSSSEAVRKMYEERIDYYRLYADHIIDNNKTIDGSVQSILKKIN